MQFSLSRLKENLTGWFGGAADTTPDPVSVERDLGRAMNMMNHITRDIFPHQRWAIYGNPNDLSQAQLRLVGDNAQYYYGEIPDFVRTAFSKAFYENGIADYVGDRSIHGDDPRADMALKSQSVYVGDGAEWKDQLGGDLSTWHPMLEGIDADYLESVAPAIKRSISNSLKGKAPELREFNHVLMNAMHHNPVIGPSAHEHNPNGYA